MGNKLGLAFGSGGAKGIAHVGVWQALEELGLKADVVTGCSSGAVIAAAYAAGMNFETVKKIVLSLERSDIVDFDVNVIKRKAFVKSIKMTELIEKYFGGMKISDMKLPFATIATDLISGEIYEFTEGSVVTAVKASCSIPVIFPPVEHEGRLLVDGGLLFRTPVFAARKLGADKVVAVDVCNDKSPFLSGNIIEIALRSIEIMDCRPDRAASHDKPDVLLCPDLKKSSPFRLENKEYIFNQGYDCCKAHADEIRAAL